MFKTAQVTNINKLRSPTFTEFKQVCSKSPKPIVITDVVNKWKAFSLWDDEYIKSCSGDKEVDVQISDNKVFRTNDKFGEQSKRAKMKLSDLIDKINQKHNLSHYYLRSFALNELPKLYQDIEIPNLFDHQKLVKCAFWLSAAENITPLHYDCYYNFLAQVKGRKRIILFPPTNISNYYPKFNPQGAVLSLVDHQVRQPDFERFPKFNPDSGIELILEAGEMLYIPAFWWHYVESIDNAISVNFFWKITKWDQLHPYFIFQEYHHYLSDRTDNFQHKLMFWGNLAKKNIRSAIKKI